MKLLIWNELSPGERAEALARPRRRTDAKLRTNVQKIVDDVCRRGWRSLCDHALKFDGRIPERLDVAPQARRAMKILPKELVSALELAHSNISRFHEAAKPSDISLAIMPGLEVGKSWRPIERVGLYVPGGAPSLFSTLLLLAVPAKIAGVGEIVVVTPPKADGTLDPALAFVAQLCGVDAIWTVGGAQAIAALAFGAGEIPAVMKIAGPGNAYVSEAKSCVASMPGGPAIDLPAGPSELMVIADESAEPALVAADLLAQAEHDANAQVMLVTTSPALARAMEAELMRQLILLPRLAIARGSLKNGRIILAASLARAVEIANLYAPEHLSLNVKNASPLIASVKNAGAIFAGPSAAESFGDYLAGSSHVLPTDGAARAFSGISVDSFMKAISIQQVDEAAARALALPAAALARLEGLEGHARAAELRLPSSERRAA
jgi:histidinol dehydrogenase